MTKGRRSDPAAFCVRRHFGPAEKSIQSGSSILTYKGCETNVVQHSRRANRSSFPNERQRMYTFDPIGAAHLDVGALFDTGQSPADPPRDEDPEGGIIITG